MCVNDVMLRDAVHGCDECPLGPARTCRFTPRTLPPGGQALRQGEAAPPLLFVKAGVLGVSATDTEGRELLTGVRGPRSMLGFEALRDEASRTTAVALTGATVCSAATFDPPLSRAEQATLLGFALDELAQAGRDADLRSGPALSRLARFLLRYGELLAPKRRAPFSKRHVAALLDMRPETLSRCLRVLADAGLVSARAQVRVKDSARLEAVANGGQLTR